VRDPADPLLDVTDGRPEARIARAAGGRLHEHLLLGMTRVMVEDRLVGAAGLAGPVLLPLERVQAGGAAAERRGDDERQPAENRRLAVPGAPAPRPGGKVHRLHLVALP